MKDIRLVNIRLLNFKGIRDLKVDFSPNGTTVISGKNGSGKSTIFDAFMWCLFGKDSQDRKNFEIKTLDSNGNAIPRIPHEVEVTLLVDGVETKIKRTYNEKWVKKRGESEETFTGHEELRYYNDVPMLVGDFSDKINDEIVTEDIFKIITNYNYFNSLKMKERRDMLLSMCGNISNLKVAEGRKEFIELLDSINGKSLDERISEVKHKASKIRKELIGFTDRIDEAQRAIPDIKLTEEQLDKQQKELDDKISSINKQLNSEEESLQEIGRKKMKLTGQIYDLNSKLNKEYLRVQKLVQQEYNKKVSEQDAHIRKIEAKRIQLSRIPKEIDIDKEILQPKLARLEELRQMYLATNDMKQNLIIDDICPTCGQQLPENDVEDKRKKARESFLKEVSRRREEINEEGSKVKDQVENINSRIYKNEDLIKVIKSEIQQLETDPILFENLGNAPEPSSTVSEIYQNLINEKAKIEKEISSLEEQKESDDKTALKQELASLISERDEIQQNKSAILFKETQEKRVENLKKEFQHMNEELAKLEKEEFTINEFVKRKVELVEGKINSLFTTVSWRMYKEQINGAYEECCDAMLDGVPYSDANRAKQINSGIDIASSIAAHMGYSAPIFIDNAEGVNNIFPTTSQQIHLVVNNKKLEIKQL